MKITKKSNMKNGTLIRIEDWSEDYLFHKKNDTLVAYPVSKETMNELFGAKKGETFRLQLNFKNEHEAELAFEELVSGDKNLADYKKHNVNKAYNDCF